MPRLATLRARGGLICIARRSAYRTLYYMYPKQIGISYYTSFHFMRPSLSSYARRVCVRFCAHGSGNVSDPELFVLGAHALEREEVCG